MPNWFDLAQDLTERWVHQMQMREAVDKVGTYRDDYLDVVIQTFVWAFPHQYQAAADPGSRVLLDLGADRAWSLTNDGTRWHLEPSALGETHLAEVQPATTPPGGGSPAETCPTRLSTRSVLQTWLRRC